MLLTALAEAKRERDHAVETARIYMEGGVFKGLERERDTARAEVERLKVDLEMLREVAAARLEDYRRAEAALARVRAAVAALVHAADTVQTIQGAQDREQWLAKTRAHVEEARAALEGR